MTDTLSDSFTLPFKPERKNDYEYSYNVVDSEGVLLCSTMTEEEATLVSEALNKHEGVMYE